MKFNGNKKKKYNINDDNGIFESINHIRAKQKGNTFVKYLYPHNSVALVAQMDSSMETRATFDVYMPVVLGKTTLKILYTYVTSWLSGTVLKPQI